MARHAELRHDGFLEDLVVLCVFVEPRALFQELLLHRLGKLIVPLGVRVDTLLELLDGLEGVIPAFLDLRCIVIHAARERGVLHASSALREICLHVAARGPPVVILLLLQVLDGVRQAVGVPLLLQLVPTDDLPELLDLILQSCDLCLPLVHLDSEVFPQLNQLSLHGLHNAERRVEGMVRASVLRGLQGVHAAPGARPRCYWRQRCPHGGGHRN
mmetsp:Transcript_84767/g.213741  ORF Transcript_84767/g.213741 Transcript_84767/m.213741 type:complete len:215 (+) Transcript_84767:163-807(+)